MSRIQFAQAILDIFDVKDCGLIEGDSQMTKVILPELGEGIKKATVTFWYFQEGQKVSEKDDLVEMATEKAAFNLPSPTSGIITEIFFREGDEIEVGEVLALIDEG